jgi:hypothetical protein
LRGAARARGDLPAVPSWSPAATGRGSRIAPIGGEGRLYRVRRASRAPDEVKRLASRSQRAEASALSLAQRLG